MFIYWLSNLAMGGGGSVGPSLISYVDPTAVTTIDQPTLDSGVDPTAVSVIA